MGGRAEDALSQWAHRAAWYALLAAAIGAGAFLRFDGLGEPSYWLDEILHQHLTDFAATTPWWRWFGQLHEEHAGLYYLTQLVTRLFGTSEFAGRSAAAFLGLATIPLLWLVPLERRVRAAAVILLAVSPLHVYYSREARGYALLLMLTAALIVILMRGRSIAAAAIVLLAMLYTSAVASTVVASAAAVAFLIAWMDRERRRWYAVAGACAAGALVLFRVIYAARPVHDPDWPGFPPVDWQLLTSLARMFSVSALGSDIAGRTAAAMFVFALIGAVVLVRRDRVQGIVLIGMTLLPFAVTLLALRVFDHFFAVRYVIAALVGYVLLVAIGMTAVASLVPSPRQGGERARVRGEDRAKAARHPDPLPRGERGLRVRAVLPVAIAIITVAQAWSSARTEPFQKLDWRGIAGSLRRHLRSGDVILAAEPWSEVSLRYYLGEVPDVKLVHMAGVGIAEIVVNDAPASWLVTAGNSGDTEVRSWMCRYPVVLSSSLENFRLHYTGKLPQRSTPAERRVLPAAMRMDDDILLGDGWAGAEGSGETSFRWAIGQRATVIFPRRGQVIRFQAYPAAPQNVRLSLNGKRFAEIAFAPDWRDYAIEVPAALWIDGPNTLAFEFEKSIVPSSRDRRELAASFRWIALDDAQPARPYTARIAAGTFIDAKTAWRNTKTSLPAHQLRRAPVEALLIRLGFDPVAGWAKLSSGAVRLDDVAETIAAGSDCEDDVTFLYRAFALLVEHPPNEGAQRDLLQRLRNGASREHIISRIVKSDDFRARVLADRQ